MPKALDSLWTRLSIVEARIQQEKSRLRADPVRLDLLERKKTSLREQIRAVENASHNTAEAA
ncbi:MAG: hypothetical protein AAF724_04790 [Pseudomonadota bacterium]